MRYTDLVTGREYVWSPKPDSPAEDLRSIKYLGTYRHAKVRISWQDGEWAGLEEWVSTRSVRCPWGQRRAHLHDSAPCAPP